MDPLDVCAVGEVLVDVPPGGDEHPGGAPANVACHAAQLGVRSALISRVGTDPRAALLRDWLASRGVDTASLQVDARRPTGWVDVTISHGQPTYEIARPVAWDELEADAPAMAAAARARVFVFGTLAQRSLAARRAIRALALRAREAGAVLVADLNLRPPFFDDEVILWTLRHCDVLKLNADELHTVSAMLGARGERVALWSGLLAQFGLRRGVLTAGGEGAWIFEDGAMHHQPAPAVEIADTIGAGDAFTAVMAAALAAGRPLRAAAPLAARVAAFVASQHGATPALPPDLAPLTASCTGPDRPDC